MRIGLLTSGGDCPGLNAVIRSVVRTNEAIYGSETIGFLDGWSGLVDNKYRRLFDNDGIDRLLRRGGTILGTGRMRNEDFTSSIDKVRATLQEHRVDAVVCIGGDGTLRGTTWLHSMGIPVVGVPKTIDNDVAATDYTFGFDTAVSIATDAIDRLHTTAESHERVILVEVMGRHAGWIALEAGMAAGAHMICIPEQPFDVDYICRIMQQRFAMGESYGICVVAEGAQPLEDTMTLREGGKDQFGHTVFTGVASQLGDEISRRTGKDVRTTVLGHVQRGGTPTARDRILATRFGVHASHAVHNHDFGTMVSLQGPHMVTVPLHDSIREPKLVPHARYMEAVGLFG